MGNEEMLNEAKKKTPTKKSKYDLSTPSKNARVKDYPTILQILKRKKYKYMFPNSEILGYDDPKVDKLLNSSSSKYTNDFRRFVCNDDKPDIPNDRVKELYSDIFAGIINFVFSFIYFAS